jgi:hypothetical protein
MGGNIENGKNNKKNIPTIIFEVEHCIERLKYYLRSIGHCFTYISRFPSAEAQPRDRTDT